MKSKEIREKFQAFFDSKGHRRHPSSSLVPDDPTLLTTSAGMVQFKPYFLAQRTPPHTRLTTVQKCLRAVDLEEVGRTPRHHTFFEMLGNFSFGDYFKAEVIPWAWEFLTKELGIPEEKLKISVYKDDEEAADIWLNKIGIAPERLYRFGEDDNYWPAGAPSKGPNGPCGPCSEIFYDFGLERGCGKPDCSPACSCNRHIEIWNLVFMQFERLEGGELIPLPSKNIDTGSGLERVASVLQGTLTNFETDIFMPIINEIENVTGAKYSDSPIPFRVIADHIRGVTFLIADGVFPSNEGRGYLLRKVLRRAAVNGRELGLTEPFLYKLVDIIVTQLGDVYPEIKNKESFIQNIVKKEEEQFLDALEQGRNFIINNKDNLSPRKSFVLSPPVHKNIADVPNLASGSTVFVAYDTYGLPLEEAEKIVRELGYAGVDNVEFNDAMEQQKYRSRKGSKMDGDVFIEDKEKVYLDAISALGKVEFDGYKKLKSTSAITALIQNGAPVQSVKAGDTAEMLADRTPFYGEMGGQIGDTGSLKFKKAKAKITDTFIVDGKIPVHKIEVISGEFKTGEKVTLEVEPNRRKDIMRHHTATHLLHAALRKHLGSHVVQSGSYVGPDKLRFDFTHHSAVDAETLAAIEAEVNAVVMDCSPVHTLATDINTAKSKGAMALFGEKYGDEVRMVSVGEFSKELCGGTHTHNTGEIGLVKITDERAIGSSMRRIEAVAGAKALEYINSKIAVLDASSSALRVTEEQLPKSIEALVEENSSLNKELKKLNQARAVEQASDFVQTAEIVNGTHLFVHLLDGVGKDGLFSIFDDIKVKVKSYAVMLAAVDGDKCILLAAFSDDLVAKGLDAGAVVKLAAQAAGGGGGGKKNIAQAGARDISKVPHALELAKKLMLEKL